MSKSKYAIKSYLCAKLEFFNIPILFLSLLIEFKKDPICSISLEQEYKETNMDLGFFTMPIHPPGRNLTETLKEDREFALFADELGFTEGLFGEHITDAAETITSGLIFIAWILQQTKNIKLGTGTVNLPNHNPAMVAAEVAMVDHMAEGRFMFGISPGDLMSDVEVFENLDNDRTQNFYYRS